MRQTRTRFNEVPPNRGNKIDLGKDREGYFSVVVPQEAINHLKNPAFKAGLSPWSQLAEADAPAAPVTFDEDYTTVYSTFAEDDRNFGVMGSASMKITPTDTGEEAGLATNLILPAGTYYFSVYHSSFGGDTFIIRARENLGALIAEKEVYGSKLTRFSRAFIKFTLDSNTNLNLYFLRKPTEHVNKPFYVSMLVCEENELTLPFHGFHPEVHLSNYFDPASYQFEDHWYYSKSIRKDTAYMSGKEVLLRDYGFYLTGHQGLGSIVYEHIKEGLNEGGSFWNGAQAQDRQFSLIGDIKARNDVDLHKKRLKLIDLLQPNNRNLSGQPTYLLFRIYDKNKDQWIGQPLYIKCRYNGGLEGNIISPNGENVAISFTSEDPFIYSSYTKYYSLDKQTYNIAANHVILLKKDKSGQYSILHDEGTWLVNCMTKGYANQIYVGGGFTNWNGIGAADRIVKYNEVTDTWSALGGGINDGEVNIILPLPNGHLVVGGSFTTVGGVPNFNGVAMWDPVRATWSSLTTGVSGGSAEVNDIKYTRDNDLIIVGMFTSAGGVANTVCIARFDLDANTWSAVGTGVITSGDADCVEVVDGSNFPLSKSEEIYLGGQFPNGVGGVGTGGPFWKWDGSSWSLEQSDWAAISNVSYMSYNVYTNKIVYSIFNPSNAAYIYDCGSGINQIINSVGAPDAAIQALAHLYHDKRNGDLHTKIYDAGGLNWCPYAIFTNKNSWRFGKFEPEGSASIDLQAFYIDEEKDAKYWILGFFGVAAQDLIYYNRVTIENNGSRVYPLYLEIVGGGKIITINNDDTEKTIYFDRFNLQRLEHCVMETMNNGKKTFFNSNMRGNIAKHIVEGSDLNWYLIPGDNHVTANYQNETSSFDIRIMVMERYESIDKAVEYI